jgi:hypothetical protein
VLSGGHLLATVQDTSRPCADFDDEHLGFEEMQTEIYLMRETHPSLPDNVPAGRTSCSLSNTVKQIY